MSEANNSSNGASGDGANGADANNQNNNNTEQVKNPEAVLAKNKELLASNAAMKAKLKEFEDAKAAAEQEKLVASGKFDDVIAALRKENAELKEAHKGDVQNFGKQSIRRQMEDVARAMGADKPEVVLKLAETSGISVDEKFNVDKDAVAAAIAKVKEEVPSLFKKQVPLPKDGTPGNGGKWTVGDLAKMDSNQLKQAYIKASQ